MKFIVWLQFSVKFSTILPRKHRPIRALIKEPCHYSDSQELKQNTSQVSSNAGLWGEEFKVAASKTLVNEACANIQQTKLSFSRKIRANHLLSSGLFPGHRQEDNSSHPWLSTSLTANLSLEQQGRHTGCVQETQGSVDRQARKKQSLHIKPPLFHYWWIKSCLRLRSLQEAKPVLVNQLEVSSKY